LLEGFGPTPGTLEPGAVIVVGSTLGITLEGVLTALVFRLMMAGGSTLTGASRAMLELKLEDTVPDEVGVEDGVVDGVCDGWLGLKRLYDCTPKLGLSLPDKSPLFSFRTGFLVRH
jgi:hypothetical protein